MAEEFIIKSPDIEDKINQLLPSQGGFQAGVDFSASTMVIPIIDLTETAEGSSLRQDLQTCFSLLSTTGTTVSNTTSTLIATTGYYRVFGTTVGVANLNARFNITDGTTTKTIYECHFQNTTQTQYSFDFNIKLEAGDSFIAISNGSGSVIQVATRQIADLAGNLVNP